MFKIRLIFSVLIFSSLLFGTSLIKNQTREIEKNIHRLSEKIYQKEKDFNESQLDFYYLTSPSEIDKKIEHLDNNKYISMEYSKIFLDVASFLGLDKKFVKQEP